MRDTATRDAVWLAALAGLGFALSFLGVSVLGLPRQFFVLGHLVVTGAVTIAFLRTYGLNPLDLGQRPLAGAMVGAAAASFMVRYVVGQPPSDAPLGWAVAWDLFWLGGFYAVLDALLLTILPALIVWHAAARKGWDETVLHWIGSAALALAASVMVTAAYHAGFPEFQGPQIIQPLIGNFVVTLAFVATRSPLAPFIAHISLHVAAVLHAIQTSVPLPPHY